MHSRATQQCNTSPYVYAVYWLQTASSAFLLAREYNSLAERMLITCVMQHARIGYTNFNGVSLLYIPYTVALPWIYQLISQLGGTSAWKPEPCAVCIWGPRGVI